MRIYLGFDPREEEACRVAAKTLAEVCPRIEPEFLDEDKLRDQGVLMRPVDTRGGQDFDLISGAVRSTEFAISRFLVPILCQSGWALFADCDMVFCEDPTNMLAEINGRHAVSVVKHRHQPVEETKMAGLTQTSYPRKNWSSVMLFNCNHPANRRLSLRDVNERPGRDLHALYWLHDDEIGDLHPRWNWLVDVQPKPENVGIAHFTLGGPFNKDWKGGSFDYLWNEAAKR